MPTSVGVHEAKTHLSEYLNRVAYRGERVVIERHGKPVAALVGLDDLRRLEARDTMEGKEEREEARKARFRREMEESGLMTFPKDSPLPRGAFTSIEAPGPPVSEQIIADRR